MDNKLELVSIGSDQSVNGKIEIGNTAKLTVKAKEAIKMYRSKSKARTTVSSEDHINWTAVATLDGDAERAI